MNGFVTDGNDINCRECKYGDKCNVGRGHGYRVGSCIQFEVEKKQTNADRIRAMSDDELAKTLSGEEIYPWCTKPCEYDNCTDCVLAWLKQEAET